MTKKRMKELAHQLRSIFDELYKDDDRYLIYHVRGNIDVAARDLEELSNDCD